MRIIKDESFLYLLRIDPALKDWVKLVAEWFKLQKRQRHIRMIALEKFLVRYISELDLERNPYAYLSRKYEAPDFYYNLSPKTDCGIGYNNMVHDFLQWVLEKKLSIKDDMGRALIPGEFHNPVPRRSSIGRLLTETQKFALPMYYLREVRGILCQGRNFRDWKWAQEAFSNGRRYSGGSDWFEVKPSEIDEKDPDCVWRTRTKTIWNGGNAIGTKEVYEMWSPVRAVAVFIKLLLPLRTHQVRMLDSGEADTLKYEKGRWVKNEGPLALGSEKRPYMQGVFHRIVDVTTNKVMTGLYINSNKTADINRPENKKGYIIPWQHDEALYWLEKLRDWQQRYNKIFRRTPWTDLQKKHFGKIPPHEDILVTRTPTCFLFREAYARIASDRSKPMYEKSLRQIWCMLLAELEKRCKARGETQKDGKEICFVELDSRKPLQFTLHSLRVTLLTAYAIDGGVPMSILSKLIAGHASVIMTLYYVKAGIQHVTDVMEEADRNIFEKQQYNCETWLRECNETEILKRLALNDSASAIAVIRGASSIGFEFSDIGICPTGGSKCDVGGVIITNAKKGNDRLKKYAPVPGYPAERNCIRCRFFISGPPFLPGLVAKFNHLSYLLTNTMDRHNSALAQIEQLEDKRAQCDNEKIAFTDWHVLKDSNRRLESESIKADKLLYDMYAAMRLIKHSMALIDRSQSDGCVELVPVGSVRDVECALKDDKSRLYQISVICKNAVMFRDLDAEKAAEHQARAIDRMLERHGKKPIMFRLSDELILPVGNKIIDWLRLREGSLAGAVAIVEGHKDILDCINELMTLIEGQTDQKAGENSVVNMPVKFKPSDKIRRKKIA